MTDGIGVPAVWWPWIWALPQCATVPPETLPKANMVKTRERMVAGAADLISRQGVHATSLRDVVEHTGTPRGSLSHHFPGGKQQMLEETVTYATQSVAGPLAQLLAERGAMGGLQAFVAWWRNVLEASGFEAGCPVLAMAVESTTHSLDEVDEDTLQGRERLRFLVNSAFHRWQDLLAHALALEGVPAARARRLSALTVASLEGTVAMCRAARSLQPLEDVQHELEAALRAALTQR